MKARCYLAVDGLGAGPVGRGVRRRPAGQGAAAGGGRRFVLDRALSRRAWRHRLAAPASQTMPATGSYLQRPVRCATCDLDATGAVFGGQVGYNWQQRRVGVRARSRRQLDRLEGDRVVSRPHFLTSRTTRSTGWRRCARRLGFVDGRHAVLRDRRCGLRQFQCRMVSCIGGPARRQVRHDDDRLGCRRRHRTRSSRRIWSARAEFLHYGFGKKSVTSTTGGNLHHRVPSRRVGGPPGRELPPLSKTADCESVNHRDRLPASVGRLISITAGMPIARHLLLPFHSLSGRLTELGLPYLPNIPIPAATTATRFRVRGLYADGLQLPGC